MARSSGTAFMAPRMTPGVKRLLIINFAIYVVYLLLLQSSSLAFIASALELTPREALLGGKLWQPLTSIFLHSPFGLGHILGNMLMLFFFGTGLEPMLGTRKFIKYYLYAGLGGSLLTILASGLAVVLFPGTELASFWSSGTIGASGAVFGIILCWGAMQWHQTANFFLLGPMKIKTFILIIVGLELLRLLTFSSGVSFTSHFGGMAMGFFLGRGGDLSWLSPKRAAARRKHRQTQKKLSRFEVIEGGGEGSNGAGKPTWIRRDDDPVIH